MKNLENSISKVPSSAKRYYNFKREKDTLWENLIYMETTELL